MSIPSSIPFSSIVFGDRARSTYDNIDLLATSIEDVGLQCPIILSPLPDGRYLLEDGGRRYRALESLGVDALYHAATSSPGRPGFVLKSEVSDDESAKITELIANLHREQLDWRDEVKLLVQAYRLRKKEAARNGEQLYYHTFAKMVGNYGYTDIQHANAIYDELIANPEKFADVTSLPSAYQVILRENEKVLRAELAARATASVTPVVSTPSDPAAPTPAADTRPVVVLSETARLGNSLDYLASPECPVFDHIICDPDFAISVDRLESNSDSAGEGVVQASVEDSLADLYRLISLASARVRSFFVFFYDLDHHEKLQRACRDAGFMVQRWPLLWHKPDHRSNAAPSHNFTKNLEYAMVCRKPSATLATPGALAVMSVPVGVTPKAFGHPFSKPIDLWNKIFTAVCNPGDTVFDPFMGAGSSVVAGLLAGLRSSGMELQEQHYHSAVLNIKKLSGFNFI